MKLSHTRDITKYSTWIDLNDVITIPKFILVSAFTLVCPSFVNVGKLQKLSKIQNFDT